MKPWWHVLDLFMLGIPYGGVSEVSGIFWDILRLLRDKQVHVLDGSLENVAGPNMFVVYTVR